ncbi:S-adenosyl-L-methionine-dependent methyltransferase [Dichotomocladium elegans]|nr:S-adenosyl-L-methionine-dependent methyltransferase [Dichotomocladium elegans]
MGIFGPPRFFKRSFFRSNKGKKITNTTAAAMSNITAESFTETNDSNISSASPHRYEGGRRYHNDENVAYILPNDEEEDDRIHLQHWAIKLAFGSNFDAPVQQDLEEGITVLDSACGPGTWTLELANTFPKSKFYGSDISPRFPEQIKPSNCEFVVTNILDAPTFQEGQFDYIHQRLVFVGIKAADWPKLLKNLMYALKPGGWIELAEFSYDDLDERTPNLKLINDISLKFLNAGGFDPYLGKSLPRLLSDAGFVNVQERWVNLPINHGGRVGELFWQDFKEALIAAKPVYSKFHLPFQEPGAYEAAVDKIGGEAKEFKSTTPWVRVIAQKPLLDDQ